MTRCWSDIEGGHLLECKGCNRMLPDGQFDTHKGGLFGKHSRCKDCRRPGHAARSARRRGAGVTELSGTEGQGLYARQRGICPLCGLHMMRVAGLHVDHRIPVSRGGQHVSWNLQLVHALCNLAKGAKLPAR